MNPNRYLEPHSDFPRHFTGASRMIHVVLSDFTADELARRKREREESDRSELARFRELDDKRQAGIEDLRRQYRESSARHRYLTAFALWFRIVFAPGPKSAPNLAPTTEAERILESGDAGQRAVIQHLASKLDDNWI